MLHLLLTLDYEIFGNGAGDVMRDVIQPTSRLLDICDRHGAKLTIMFDVAEYWAFVQHAEPLARDLGYSPSEQMRLQAIDAVRRGHDVQLHLHPQWIGAQYDEGAWRLSNSQWRLADLPGGFGRDDEITSILGALHQGKQTLEAMLKPAQAGYQCVCFRAGGFYAQPSPDVIRGIKRAGLIADSSVVKGHRTSTPFEVDYSGVKTGRQVWWTTDSELTEEGKPGVNVMELCVSSRMEPYWKSLKMTKLRATLKRGRAERVSCAHHQADGTIRSVPSLRTVWRKLFRRHASLFDFCKLSARDMLGRIREYRTLSDQPIVLIGHSKDFFNERGLDRFLATVKHDERIAFETVSQFVAGAASSTSGL